MQIAVACKPRPNVEAATGMLIACFLDRISRPPPRKANRRGVARAAAVRLVAHAREVGRLAGRARAGADRGPRLEESRRERQRARERVASDVLWPRVAAEVRVRLVVMGCCAL